MIVSSNPKVPLLAALITLIIGGIGFHTARTTHAQETSPGCALINSGPQITIDRSDKQQKTWEEEIGVDFYAGETITWDLQASSAESLNVTEGMYDGKSGDTIFSDFENYFSFSGPGGDVSLSDSYTIPTSDSYEFYFVAEATGSGLSSANISATVTCSPAPVKKTPDNDDNDDDENVSNVVPPPDNRINWRYGDLHAVIYPNGDDGVSVYCYEENSDDTWLGMQVNQATVDNAPTDTPQDVPVKEVNRDGCRVAFYILDSGEYQINVWAPEGKFYEILADNVNFDNPTMRYYDPGE